MMSKMMIRWAVLLCLLLPPLLQAADALPWEALSAAEQQVLQPYAGRWDSMSPSQQRRLQRGARRWAEMDREERQAARERFRHWQQMPESQKRRIRERYERFRELDPAVQQRLRQRMQEFRRLPPEQQQALRQRWEAQQQVQGRDASAEVTPDAVGSETPPTEHEDRHRYRSGDRRIERQRMERMPGRR